MTSSVSFNFVCVNMVAVQEFEAENFQRVDLFLAFVLNGVSRGDRRTGT